MPLAEYKQGSVICQAGEPMENLLFITKGNAQVSFGGHSFIFEQGDALGLSALNTGIYIHTYAAVTDVTAFSYPYEKFSDLKPLLRDNVDVAIRLVGSMCRQVANFLLRRHKLKQQADKAFLLIQQTYPAYEGMCNRFAFAPKKLLGITDVVPPATLDPIDEWMHDYYMEMRGLDTTILKTLFGSPGLSMGFVYKAAGDIVRIMEACDAYQEYLKKTSQFFLDESGHDLFAFIAELHVNSVSIKDADEALKTLVQPLLELLADLECIDVNNYTSRLAQYKENLTESRAGGQVKAIKATPGVKSNLADSLHIILEYSGCPEEVCNKFARNVVDFTKVPDRGSSDDVVYALRRDLTAAFYDIYKAAFLKSLKDPAPPTIIKMFLNFGYVDATLAGHENADYLYSIADGLKGDPVMGVYTVSEWLTAIYNGDKEPSRNDFDEDYAAFVKEMRVSGKIDTKEEAVLLADPEGKLLFEMEHVFPIVNKITYGRMATFCPLFADSDVQRKLDTALVRPELVRQTLDEILSIDFSAYARETLYSNAEFGVPKETVHLEFLPDFILMPNAGARGAMWQEIEGRKRATPSRMFLPIFLMGELKNILIRLTAEFRWEMCKRIQGARWNDMSDPSLTSEFFDYLQFYKSNRELSSETKVAVKAELLRAKNVYKAVFVQNYADWLLYESKGSPRLNKFARKILFTYCPFSAPIREKVALNPQYTDILKRYEMLKAQREKRLTNAVQKIVNLSKETPHELVKELEFLKR